MGATWKAIELLARSPAAQPVAFAFGGEARPDDYARVMADAGLLALMSCLGLAQASHEVTPMAAPVVHEQLALLWRGWPAHPSRRHPLGADPAGPAEPEPVGSPHPGPADGRRGLGLVDT